MIAVDNLQKSIKGAKILNDISFEVNDGEILGFLGPNGAGKSTTMKIITGFWAPTAGTVHVGDLDIAKDSLRIRQKIGYLPETVPLYDDMRVIEYLRFIANIRGIAPGQVRARLKQVVSDCGLTDVLKKSIDELSKGYRQRVGLAQAIIHEPDILILDEPTTGLDPNQIVEIRNLIKSIGKDKTVIFSTHILSEVTATCDRVIIINQGQIVGQGTPRELTGKISTQEIIYVKIKGPVNEVIAALQVIPNVAQVSHKDSESDDIFGYEIISGGNDDIREALSREIMKRGWSILEFNRQSASMEDVFRELTK